MPGKSGNKYGRDAGQRGGNMPKGGKIKGTGSRSMPDRPRLGMGSKISTIIYPSGRNGRGGA